MPKRLNKAQRSLMLDILSAINSEDFDEAKVLLSEAPEWFKDWTIYSAGENMPGYMPDSPYLLFLTDRAARGHCRELEREAGGGAYVSDYMPITLREVLP